MNVLYIFLFIFFISINCFSQNKTEEYIETYKHIAIVEMNKYAIPASITLAQGILESGNGESRLAMKGNNHFGIKCHNDWKGEKIYKDDDSKNECFRSYNKVSDSFRDHSIFLSERDRYQFLFSESTKDYKKWAMGLKQAGYATNPNYANRLIEIIEKYDLNRYDEDVYNNRDNYIGISFGLPFGYGIGKYWFLNESLYSLEIQSAVMFSSLRSNYHHNIINDFYFGANIQGIYISDFSFFSGLHINGSEHPYLSITPEILYRLIRKQGDILIRTSLFPIVLEEDLDFSVTKVFYSSYAISFNLTYLVP